MSIRKRQALLSAVVSVCAVLVSGCLDNGLDTALSEDLLPKAPTNVSATAESQTSITVSWSSLTGIKGYRVYRSASAAWKDSTLVGSSTSSSYIDKDLLSNKTYYYKVSACNGSGESSTSSTVNATTKLGTPTNVTADAVSSSSIRVSWSPVNGADEYRVYRSTDSIGPYSQVGISISTSYTDNTVASNLTYYYKVSAYNAGAATESLKSEFFSTKINLNAPINVSANPSSGSIIINWSPVSGAVRYHVYRATSSSGPYSQVGTVTSSPYTDYNVVAGQTYYYKVTAYNGTMESSQSPYASAKIDLNPPSSVSALVVVPSTNSTSNSIIVVWAAVGGVTGYKVYRSTSSGGSYSQVGSSTSTSYTDNNLSNGTTYYYKVSATTSTGVESSQSSYASATIRNAPDGVQATANSSTSITVSWDWVSGVTGYNVYRRVGTSGSYSQLGTVTSTSYTDNNVSAGTTYYYKVSAYYGNVESLQSSAASARTVASSSP